jgi:two-component system OmpR family sensor kinase
MRSIRRQLLLWLLLGLIVATAAAAFAVYLRARAEARDLFDYQLQLMAAAFPNEGFGSATAPPLDEANVGDVVVVEIWDRNGVRLYLSRPESPPPQSVDIGFSTVTTPQGDWRIYSTVVGDNVVQVSQPTSVRERLAASLALRTMLPLLILLPVLIAVIWITVGRGLRPLNEVAYAVGKRSADALEPLPDGRLPKEVKPLVAALNDLLARLGRSLSLQRSFIADAAHELRTPLTAVRLQLQLAERASTNAERATAFAELKGGIGRATHLIEQLLTLARNEPDAVERTFAMVNLADIARQVVAERASIAEAKRLDLGLSGDAPILTMGDAEALRAMLGNLVDNAIHYTPPGGIVDVEVAARDGHACLTVTDTGPGIPAADRERVFDRFYRLETAGATGSGLGLAIVRKIAQRHRASVDLGSEASGRGLKATVCFPAE